ncbi:tRNA (adenosine(37)-N6)-threonylcarbamoyltransferase complex dimerization subunit type 1 TsaB [Pontibacter cellulosilyticus]|uniref:tRNA (Adenosine(37)-N6)-threonylcarbamoyltransferase complex dimerization subunit type 1 TsaB n=1 Tax=Pontibacter cellulosilyticus TaxID=1720253 RepID=A0A923N9E2_9BACT|nr:tRNA (adenosine(37)-N6)-threonylcarbamoyltransferase complex dimerization subunit type 1 TsaB [Pontibacter cellulosilyticus]MBC5994671.1 tRNA (adenosine(37)-N6)-threonylcarbamoyltransferase complex dimerization subunit type 1 TsaB [Pontibacter cellulosilyticus]
MESPLLLALETSTTVCSVALYQGEHLLGSSELRIEKSHSSHITVMMEQLVNNCGFKMDDLKAVAVSGGPGSYTGLRIGTSTAKGLCYALNIPLIEVSTLYSMAAQVINYTANPERFLFCPMLDARRMEVYTCVLSHTLEEVMPIAPVILTEDSLHELLQNNQVIFFGSGAEKFKTFAKNNVNALFVDGVVPSAIPVGKLALRKYEKQIFEDVAYYEPFYLKDVYITSASKSTN